jgi:hypothetical protein
MPQKEHKKTNTPLEGFFRFFAVLTKRANKKRVIEIYLTYAVFLESLSTRSACRTGFF